MGKTITLLKAAQVPLRGPIRPSGFTATVDDETFQSLSDRGLIAVEDIAQETEAEGMDDSGSDDDPVEDIAQGTEAKPEGLESTSSVTLPPMTAPLVVWKEAADKLGIKTGSMKKPEIIGAVKAHLNK